MKYNYITKELVPVPYLNQTFKSNFTILTLQKLKVKLYSYKAMSIFY